MEKTVAQIMDSSPPTVSPDDDIGAAIKLMREREVPGLPVVDGEGRLVGILTESDLVIRDVDVDLHLPHFLDLLGGVVFIERMEGFERRIRKAFAASVSDLMSSDPDTASPGDSVRQAARRIHDSGHNRLPVVDSDGKLVGVVTRMDVLAALTEED